MGTLLQARGLRAGEMPERWNLSHAEEIVAIHKAYFDAGSNVVNTNTFGANCLKFGADELDAIIGAAIAIIIFTMHIVQWLQDRRTLSLKDPAKPYKPAK